MGVLIVFPLTFLILTYIVKYYGLDWSMYKEHASYLSAMFALFVSMVLCVRSVGEKWYEYGLDKSKPKIQEAEEKIRKAKEQIEQSNMRFNEAMHYAKTIKEAFNQRAEGFKSIHREIAELDKIVDNGLAKYLALKRRPAYKAAEVVKRETKMRREAEFRAKVNASIIEYYEHIYPDLIEIRENELSEDEKADAEVDYRYTKNELEDPVTKLLSRAEYMKMSPAERNQKALDRYWKRKHSPKELGRMYERYVGFLYESQGYSVEYFGINNGMEDLGRDLVCRKGKTVVIVQCKYWSQHKKIYENRIFQHFGTVFEYKMNNKDNNVIAAFYTTTKLSDLARNFAKEIGMKLVENHRFDKSYPCIKCNIGSDGSKIYHLPFDQQYDNAKIDKKGEFFASTVKEAEAAGFRRAYKWHGKKS